MEFGLTETDKLKLEYLKRARGLTPEARERFSKDFTEVMRNDDTQGLARLVTSMPVGMTLEQS